MEKEAVEFLQQALDLALDVLPVASIRDVRYNAESNTDEDRVVGSFQLPLVYGAGQSDQGVSKSDYSAIYQVFIEYELAIGSGEQYLAVDRSKFEIRVRTSPGIRFEDERGYTSAPTAHIHSSGISGLLSVALMANFEGTKAKDRRKGDLQALHFPVGGRRFRPSLEDFLYFVIRECGFRGRPDWEGRLLQSREEWLDKQLRAAVRDHPAEAAEALRELGYNVEPPSGGDVEKRRKRTW